jgi:hypothetical protein
MSPTSATPGSITWLSLIGKGLQTDDLLLCPRAPQITGASPILVSQNAPASDTLAHFNVCFSPGISDTYDVHLLGGPDKKTGIRPEYDGMQQLTIGNSDDQSYVGCGLGVAQVSTNGNVACGFAPLTYDATRQIFGKGVADRFLAVQLTVRNTSTDLEYLFQGVRLGTPALMQESLDKKLIRGVAEKTEQFSNRAIIFRLTAAGATLLTGIAGVVDNNLLTSASSILGGPVQTGLTGAIPNLTTTELARVDDLGFTTTSTVIPKNSSVPVVAFLSFYPFYTKQSFQSLEKNPDALQGFWKSLRVQISGVHVQQMDLGSPTLTSFVNPPPDSGAVGPADLGVPIAGTALASVTSVLLECDSSVPPQKIVAQLSPLAGQALDNNVDKVVIPAGTALQKCKYEVYFVTKDNPSRDTQKALAITK